MPLLRKSTRLSPRTRLQTEVEALQDQYAIAQSLDDKQAMRSLEKRIRKTGTFPGDPMAKRRVTMFKRSGKMVVF